MRKLAVLLLVLNALSAGAQSSRLSEKDQRKLAEADQYLADKSYGKAGDIYRELLEFNESDIYLKLKVAETCLALHNSSEASEWYMQVFKEVGRDVPSDIPSHHIYNYAEILLANGDVGEALSWYKLYKKRNPSDTRSDRKIEGIRNMEDLKKSVSAYEIGPVSLNSKYPDFSPSFYNHGLVFASGRAKEDNVVKNVNAPHGTFLDLYYCAFKADGGLSEVEKFSDVINTDFNEGPSVFYEGDRKVIFTRNNLKGKTRAEEESVIIQLQLFYSEMDTITKAWKKPELFPIHSEEYSIGHPAISADGQRLYFSSNMPGSYGGTDLYLSEKIIGSWTEPKNLGPAVNTEGNEMFPFLCADSVLYFASDGHGGFGGLDIYRYAVAGQKIENVGAPINGGHDDFGLILDPSGNTGYFSSNRNGKGGDNNDDIFYFKRNVIPDSPAVVQEVVSPQDTSLVVVEVYYTVQILAVRNPKMVARAFLKDLKGVLKYDGKDGLYRYTYGRYDSVDEATVVLNQIKDRGYSDAFLRRVQRYAELSGKPGFEVDEYYKKHK